MKKHISSPRRHAREDNGIGFPIVIKNCGLCIVWGVTEISKIDPFSNADTLLTIVKDMERRWGLTLVSFLPASAQERVALLQKRISRLAYRDVRPGNPSIEFYQHSHLHCTHVTLKRSSAWGPVMERSFVREGHNLLELFKIIHRITSQIPFISVEFDTLQMSPDGLGIVLVGRCSDDESTEFRGLLLDGLNNALSEGFILDRRPWDTDPSKYHMLHCRIAFLKRPLENYEKFTEHVLAEKLHIRFVMKEIHLIHHQYRSLLPPHQGEFTFPLGSDIEAGIKAGDFIRRLGLRTE